jgi:oligoendopeptidase F
MKAWNWLYRNPEASPEELKEALISIAKEVWNTYYADIFKIKDQPILAIYSHLINSALYLPDYPLGQIIAFQIEKFLEGKNLGEEIERMCCAGKITPQLWMRRAVGSRISTKPLLDAVDETLKK